MTIVAGIIGICIICTLAVLWFIEIAQDDPTETEYTDGIFTSRDDWLHGVADLDQSPERKAVMRKTEGVLVGGPLCGWSVVLESPGQMQWTEVRNGIYYRWDRTERVCNGQVVFQLATILACQSQDV